MLLSYRFSFFLIIQIIAVTWWRYHRGRFAAVHSKTYWQCPSLGKQFIG